MELQVLVLSGKEMILGYLNPEIVDIKEINSYSGIKQIEITHPLSDGETDYDYDSLLNHGNKIWRNQTGDGDACLYVINSEKEKDNDNITVTAEEVLVELNDCGVVDSISASPITVNQTNLETWFGNWFTIGTFETPTSKSTISFTGTLTKMALLRLIEEETYNVFVTRYEKDDDSNIIHRYLDFKQSIGVEHPTPIEIGENTDKIEISINEDDTYRSIVPIIKDSDSGATEDTVKTSQVLSDFKALAVSVGESIPMIVEKKQDGTEEVTAYWYAPYRKSAGSYEVYLAPEQIASTYNNIYYKEAPEGGIGTGYNRRIGTVETSETNKYVIYNRCALKLMDKKDPVLTIEADVNDLKELPGGDIPYNVGDTVHIRLPHRAGIITSTVQKTEKNPRTSGSNKITIGNSVSGGTVSKSDISRPAGLDSITLSSIFTEIGDVSDSVPDTADDRINTLCPGIADTEINSIVPGLISTAIAGKLAMDEFTIGNQSGSITFSNGLHLEWGIATVNIPSTSTPGSTSINFTRTFNSPPLVVVTAYGSASLLNVFWGYSSISVSSFSLNAISSSTTGDKTGRWFAIGKRSGY